MGSPPPLQCSPLPLQCSPLPLQCSPLPLQCSPLPLQCSPFPCSAAPPLQCSPSPAVQPPPPAVQPLPLQCTPLAARPTSPWLPLGPRSLLRPRRTDLCPSDNSLITNEKLMHLRILRNLLPSHDKRATLSQYPMRTRHQSSPIHRIWLFSFRRYSENYPFFGIPIDKGRIWLCRDVERKVSPEGESMARLTQESLHTSTAHKDAARMNVQAWYMCAERHKRFRSTSP